VALPAASTAPATAASTPAPAAAKPAAVADQNQYITIKSPMIGTLYRSATPENPPLVSVGDEIQQGQVICIIEAMKLFNEIEAEVSGKVVKVLIENASPVEYDQPLFLIDPS
jgi:acetyl-CoA carboxylase biotin carboxyl carrier protein